MKRSQWFEGLLYMEESLKGATDKESLLLALTLSCIELAPYDNTEFMKGCLDYIKYRQRLMQC